MELPQWCLDKESANKKQPERKQQHDGRRAQPPLQETLRLGRKLWATAFNQLDLGPGRFAGH
jgi:hypothetical protein